MLCSQCNKDLPEEDFYKDSRTPGARRQGCKECSRKKNNKNYAVAHANTDARRVIARRSHLKHKYGITLEDYDALFAKQGGTCAICQGTTGHVAMKEDTLCVDHDHNTGEVRGLLCHPCNVMIGKAQDNSTILRRGAAYLDNLNRAVRA